MKEEWEHGLWVAEGLEQPRKGLLEDRGHMSKDQMVGVNLALCLGAESSTDLECSERKGV